MKNDNFAYTDIHNINIYFDTEDFQLIRSSVEKPKYKEKIRLRSYSIPKSDDKVFLELKKKFDGIVHKRRIALNYDEILDLNNIQTYMSKTQIGKELKWTLDFYYPVPKMYIGYHRFSLKGVEEDIRITFDTNLYYRIDNLNFIEGKFGEKILQKNQLIMEIKTLGGMPLWLAHALNQYNILPSSFSKYGTAYKHFVLTLALLPEMVQMVIILVNGNFGTGVAVMGAFSLVRFRSIPGGAREIGNIFSAMGVGLACGMGYLVIATVFLYIIGLLSIVLLSTSFGNPQKTERDLKILIPENLDYTEIFNDLFKKYTIKHDLVLAKTTNMGSLYELLYTITLKDVALEKILSMICDVVMVI